MIIGDHVVFNGRRCREYLDSGTVDESKALQHGAIIFIVEKLRGRLEATIHRGNGGPIRTHHGDISALKSDGPKIKAGRHQYYIAILGRKNRRLDIRRIGGNMDGILGKTQAGQQGKKAQTCYQEDTPHADVHQSTPW